VCNPHHTRRGHEKHMFSGLVLKPVTMVWPQNHNYGLVIWVPKSPRCILGLGLKIKGRRFAGLHLKTDEWMKTV
jgi:hypothetical protein